MTPKEEFKYYAIYQIGKKICRALDSRSENTTLRLRTNQGIKLYDEKTAQRRKECEEHFRQNYPDLLDE